MFDEMIVSGKRGELAHAQALVRWRLHAYTSVRARGAFADSIDLHADAADRDDEHISRSASSTGAATAASPGRGEASRKDENFHANARSGAHRDSKAN